jgi:hypothetical protein
MNARLRLSKVADDMAGGYWLRTPSDSRHPSIALVAPGRRTVTIVMRLPLNSQINGQTMSTS